MPGGRSASAHGFHGRLSRRAGDAALAKAQIRSHRHIGGALRLRGKDARSRHALFFGYTRCPDVCPMHMAYLAAALKKLPRDVANQITVVFVTTDPDHDTRKVLRAWLDNFDKTFVGLTGTQSAIDAAQIAANIPPAKKASLANGTSGISHAAFVLAYTKDNLAHVIYPSGISQADWLHDLPQLVTSSWKRPF